MQPLGLHRRALMWTTVIVTIATPILLAAVVRVRMSAGEPTPIPGLWVKRHQLELGMIQPAAVAETSIEFVNKGSASVSIDSAIPDCGCTVVDLGTREIPVGGTLRIPVTINPGRIAQGTINKNVVVRVRATGIEPKDIFFHLTGSIEQIPLVTLTPTTTDFGDFSSDASSLTGFAYVSGPRELVNAVPDSIKILALSNTILSLHYPPITRFEPASKMVKLDLSPNPNWPSGDFKGVVHLKFDGSKHLDSEIQFRGNILAPIVSEPARLYVVRDFGDTATGVLVKISTAQKKSIDIQHISSDLPITWTVRDHSADNDRVTLEVRSSTKDQSSELAIGYLRIKLEKQIESLAIPVVLVTLKPLRSGSSPAEPLRWLGQGEVSCRFAQKCCVVLPLLCLSWAHCGPLEFPVTIQIARYAGFRLQLLAISTVRRLPPTHQPSG